LAGTKKPKPDFQKSAPADKAKELYTAFFNKVQELYEKDKVKDGIFQAMMDVALVNDGPVGVNYTSLDGEVCQFCLRCALLIDAFLGHFGD
jgi:D-aminoacyl-tRNA deacylase